jgi:zinc protease
MKLETNFKMGRTAVLRILVITAVLFAFAGSAFADGIVDHPDKLEFPELTFKPPKQKDFYKKLDNGMSVFIAENHVVPTFEITVRVRTGSIYEPIEKAGISGITAYMMRNGGITGMTAKEMDERLAYLAGSVNVSIGRDQGSGSLFCLMKDMDEGLEILKNVMRNPVFEQEALDRHKGDILSELEQRNSSTSRIERREWSLLLYGDHPSTTSLRRTEQSIASISREDLIAYHKRFFNPSNFIISVSGDFKKSDVIKKLNALFADWPNEKLDVPEIPDRVAEAKPGVYMIKKEDVNQSRIRVGHLGVKRDIPEQFALVVMNDILGGGGFTSRITRRVRSDEGLAYSTGSRFDRPVDYPGTFRAWFQTKHETAAFGTGLIVDEIKRIREEKCDKETVELSKASILSQLTNAFGSKSSIVNTFASDAYTGRSEKYWQDYRKNVEAVTADDVLAAAKKFLHPDKLVYLVVGDPDAVEAGSEKHPERFSDFGAIEILPLRDPMTFEVK